MTSDCVHSFCALLQFCNLHVCVNEHHRWVPVLASGVVLIVGTHQNAYPSPLYSQPCFRNHQQSHLGDTGWILHGIFASTHGTVLPWSAPDTGIAQPPAALHRPPSWMEIPIILGVASPVRRCCPCVANENSFCTVLFTTTSGMYWRTQRYVIATTQGLSHLPIHTPLAPFSRATGQCFAPGKVLGGLPVSRLRLGIMKA